MDGATDVSTIHSDIAASICRTRGLDDDAPNAIKTELRVLPEYITTLLQRFTRRIHLLSPEHVREIKEKLEEQAPNAVWKSLVILLAQASFVTIKKLQQLNLSEVDNIKISLEGVLAQLKHDSLCSPLDIPLSSGHLEVSDFQKNPPLVRLEVGRGHYIPAAELEKMYSLEEIPGKSVALIGAGGGSDCIQAGILATLCRSYNKDVRFVASVRSMKTTSEDLSGRMGIERTVENHGGEIGPGVVRITEKSRGSGRFVENIPAKDFEMYLIMENKEEGGLAAQVAGLITESNNRAGFNGDLETFIIVDTGGDILQDPEDGVEISEQHQDLRVLHGLSAASSDLRRAFPKLTINAAIVSPGIDSPDGSICKLQKANARFYHLTKSERSKVFETYRRWKFAGAKEDVKEGRYGKTPFSWMASLEVLQSLLTEHEHKFPKDDPGVDKEEASKYYAQLIKERFHTAALPLPAERVLDEKNPWDPFVPLQEVMAGILFIQAKDLVEVVAPGL